MRFISENERRILALVAEKGALTKGDLSAMGQMAWATVVKYVGRLQQEGVLVQAGTAPRAPQLGKNSYLYELGAGAPRFLGVDIEYRATRVAIVNLRRQILWQTVFSTPQLGSEERFIAFVEQTIMQKVMSSAGVGDSGHQSPYGSILGVGIGMPRWLLPEGRDAFSLLSDNLSERLSIPVRAENNIRAYTRFKEPRVRESDYLVVGVRNGIGVGLVLGGSLYRGEEGLAGEIGHIIVEENGRACRCGKRGCLETVVNQHTLYEEFLEKIGQDKAEDITATEAGLPGMFHRAARGNSAARSVLSEAAKPLGRALATLLLVLNVKNIYLVGHFGEDGDTWLDDISDVVRRNVDPHLNFRIHYRPIEDEGYLLGAAMLVSREYLDYSVLGGEH